MDQLATRVAATLPEHSLFAELKRSQQNEQRDRESSAAIELIKRQYKVQEEGKREEYFEMLHAEYNKVLGERDFLRKENQRLYDENRGLNYRISQQWVVSEAPTLSSEEICPHPTISDRAKRIYLDLDKSEQELINSLLEKLLRSELRENQSEVEHFTDEGTCYIYPKSRTNGGRRILYLLNSIEIRICEIYTCHDTYERARSNGWRQSDYLSATPWSLPAKDGTQIPLPM